MKQKTAGKKLALWLAAGLMTAVCGMTAMAASKTRLDTVQNTYWDDDNRTKGCWDEVEDAYQYEIYLYRDDSRAATLKTKKNYLNMEKKMTQEGSYTFKVRALAKSNSKEFADGYWSEESDDIYIDESFAELMKNGGTIDNNTSGPGAKPEGTPASDDISVIYTPQWIQDAVGWKYRLSDGTNPHDGWWQDPANSVWYIFDSQGYMRTGWIDWNNARYYCLPSGAMVTGDTTVEGTMYHFDASGALQQ